VVSKSKKPIFRIAGLSENTKEPEELDESKILSLIDDLFNSKEGEISKVVVFKDPSIEVKLE